MSPSSSLQEPCLINCEIQCTCVIDCKMFQCTTLTLLWLQAWGHGTIRWSSQDIPTVSTWPRHSRVGCWLFSPCFPRQEHIEVFDLIIKRKLYAALVENLIPLMALGTEVRGYGTVFFVRPYNTFGLVTLVTLGLKPPFSPLSPLCVYLKLHGLS